MAYPMFWCRQPYHPKLADAAEKAVEREPLARATLALIGYSSSNTALIESRILGDAKVGRASVLWVSPANADLDKGAIDVAGLPAHPSVAALMAMLAGLHHPTTKAPIKVGMRLLYECANQRGDKQGLRYVSPEVFRATFDGIAAQAPPNVSLVWSYGPNGFPYKPAEWEPKVWHVGDCSSWGLNHLNPGLMAGKNANAQADYVRAKGKPFIIGEGGAQGKDFPGGITDEGLRDYVRALFEWCVAKEARLVCAPINSTSYGMDAPWTDFPLTTATVRKAIQHPGTFAQPSGSPLVAAGLAA